MKSMRTTMIHNETRAKNIRFVHMEEVRQLIMDKAKAAKLPDSFAILHMSAPSDSVGGRMPVMIQIELKSTGSLHEEGEVFAYIIEQLKDETSEISDLNQSSEIKLIGVSFTTGLHSQDAAMMTGGGETLAKGVKTNITFVDDSFVTFIVEESGMVGFFGSTHPLPVDHFVITRHLDLDSPSLKDMVQNITSQGFELLEDSNEVAMNNEYYVAAILSAMSSTREEINMFW